MGNTVFHAFSYLACHDVCQGYQIINQLSTISYALLCHDRFNVLTDIDLVAFIPTRGHTCI